MFDDYQPPERRASRNNQGLQRLKSLPLQMNQTLRSGYDYFLPEIKQLYKRLFNNREEVIQFAAFLPFKQNKEEPIMCNKEISKREISYRCFDCLIHQGSMICQKCFKEGNHKNHRYRQIKQQGCCDCGNERILNSQGFCQNHKALNQQRKVQIPTEKRVVFQLYMKQMFIWGLKLWSGINSRHGIRYFYHFLKYLSQLNKNSPYYNSLTVNLLFHGTIPIMSQTIHLGLAPSEFKDQISSVIFEFIQILMQNSEFKQKLLPVFIQMYNTTNSFETSIFAKIVAVLLSDSLLVENAMRNAQETLNPAGRDYNILTYYEHLMMLRFLKPQSIELFFAPLIKKYIVPSTMLQKIEKECQPRNSKDYFLSTVTENVQQQFIYYKLLSMIIGAVNDKNLLKKIIFNYAKKITQCKFRVNKIVLIPQRIFTLAVFKYFDFQIENVNLNELRSILDLDKKDMNQFLSNFMFQQLNCLGQYALDLVRNTYFYNYRSIYVKEESQAVMIDYLAVKIIAFLFINAQQTHHLTDILRNCAQKSIYCPDRSLQSRKDSFDRWIKMVQILIEIIYSPKTDIINCIFLNNTKRMEKSIANLLARIVKTRGKINQNELDSIVKNFFFNENISPIILQVVSLNKNSKKYQIAQGSLYSKSQEINFSLLTSLCRTELHGFVNTQKQTHFKLQPKQIQLRNALLNAEFIDYLLEIQFGFLKSLPLEQYFSSLIELTKITVKLHQFFELEYDIAEKYIQSYRQHISQYQEILSQRQNNSMLSSAFNNFKVEIQKILGKQKRIVQKEDEQLKKRKALAKAKKQRLIKDKKMIENRQIYLGKSEPKNEEAKQNQSGQLQECLVCKEKERSNKLCYFAKVKINNILVNVYDQKIKHLMFYSCFHMVHLQCFQKHNMMTEKFSCPLCHAACNIVLPYQQNSLQVPQIYQLLLSNIKKSLKYQPDNLNFEITIFLVYLVLINIQNEALTERQIRLCRSLYQFICFNYGQPQTQKLKGTDKKNKFSNVLSKSIEIIQELVQYAAKESMYQQCEELVFHDIAGGTYEQLSSYFSKFQSYRIVKNLIRILNPSILGLIDWGENLKQQSSQRIIKFNQLPKTMIQLFQLRDIFKCKKDFNHCITICVLCSQRLCQECKQLRTHSQKFHHNESIYFKTNTGGFIYDHPSIELQIRSFFVNQLGKIWKPQYSLKEFKLDEQLFAKLCAAAKSGNLFYFLSHNFEGLSNKNLDDII